MWSGASHPEIDFGPSGPTWIKGTDASTRSMLIDFKLASRQQQLTWISETLHSYPSLFLSDLFRWLLPSDRTFLLNGKSNDQIMNEMAKSSQACSVR